MDKMTAAFFEFVFDRQAVWHKRTALGLPAPWTDDNILQNFRFCNVYRELDGGTIAIDKYLAQPLPAEQKLFNIIAYRFLIGVTQLKICSAGCFQSKILTLKPWKSDLTLKKKKATFFQMRI